MQWSIPEFAAWFQPQHNPGIDPWSIKRTDTRHLIHVDKNGNTRRVTPACLFASNLWELVGRRGLLTNAIKEDEDIALFIADNDVLTKLERCRLKNEFTFTCPYCGEEFNRKIGHMIGRRPKCPQCKDVGFYKEQMDDRQAEGYFLTRKKEKLA